MEAFCCYFVFDIQFPSYLRKTYVFLASYDIGLSGKQYKTVTFHASTFYLFACRRIEAVTRDSRSMSFLWQRLSVAVQKGNAPCVLGTEHCEAEDTLGCF